VSAEVERLRTQHADAVREKSASDSKCRKLTDKVAALEREKADLRHQLAAERREANEAIAKEQAVQAEAKLARAEGNLAKELSEHLQERLAALESRAKGPRLRCVRRLNGRARSLWIHIVSWVRGPVTSRCQTESPGFVVCNGCRRSCRNSPLSWGGLCRTPPWSPARRR
jgi:predicted  nucleic acid-binding Zn-ribbon protein